MTAREQRHLAAIFVLDVYGFSKMMARDESGTLARVLEQQREVIEPQISGHDGRVVKLMGDGVLAEFPSVTSAVQAAVAIQSSVAKKANTHDGSTGDDPLLVRIGINLGEVISEGSDIYGDGVNVAARLEALARPGGIALSEAAHSQLKLRPPLNFENIGPHQVKNIPEPVQVYHLSSDLSVSVPDPVTPPRRTGRMRRTLTASVLAFVAAGAIWYGAGQPFWSGMAVADPLASFDPDKPSVVVLPFDDLTGQSDQRYFSDGITDNLITDLSRVAGLLVIARHTSFSYQDQTINIPAVGDDLGVKYVITGSVQRSSDRVRINAALTDADTGFQLWADRFDRDSNDLFALQDEITSLVVDALAVEITQEEQRLLALQDTDSVDAYDRFLKARSLALASAETSRLLRTRTVDGSAEDAAAAASEAALNEALELDPDFVRAQALMAVRDFDLPAASLLTTKERIAASDVLARQALEDKDLQSGDILPKLYSIHAMGLGFDGRHKQAVQAARQAVIVDPNYAYGYAMLGWVLQFAGEPEDAITALQIAKRLDPHWPALFSGVKVETHFALGDDQAALTAADSALTEDPENQRVRLYRAAALANLGQFDAATRALQLVLLREPKLTLAHVPEIAPYRSEDTLARLMNALRIAGLPEGGDTSG